MLDCGTGLDDPPARAALACADQLVLVCDDEPDTASIVSEAAEWLRRIEPPLVLVVNNVRRSSRIEVAALEREMSFAHGLAVIPRDERAAGQAARQPLLVEAGAGRLADTRPRARRTARIGLAAPRDRRAGQMTRTSVSRAITAALCKRHSRRLRNSPIDHCYTHELAIEPRRQVGYRDDDRDRCAASRASANQPHPALAAPTGTTSGD